MLEKPRIICNLAVFAPTLCCHVAHDCFKKKNTPAI